MILRVDIPLECDEDIRVLAGMASAYYSREDPRKAWKEQEYKEAARLAVSVMIREMLNKKRQHVPG